jgi:hypothetical protein
MERVIYGKYFHHMVFMRNLRDDEFNLDIKRKNQIRNYEINSLLRWKKKRNQESNENFFIEIKPEKLFHCSKSFGFNGRNLFD